MRDQSMLIFKDSNHVTCIACTKPDPESRKNVHRVLKIFTTLQRLAGAKHID